MKMSITKMILNEYEEIVPVCHPDAALFNGES